MDIEKQLLDLLISSELARYPDVNLYNAAKKLQPGDRPTVPVRLYDDPTAVYAALGMETPNMDAGALVGPEKDVIYVNRKKESYKDLNRLAGVLAHEQNHVEGGDETDAKLKEYEVLRKLISRWKFNPRLNELEEFQRTYGKKK